MTDVEKTLSEYRRDHQNIINEILHFFGIPLILFSLIILANSDRFAIIFQIVVGILITFYITLRNWRAVLVGMLMAIGFYTVEYLKFQSWQWGLILFATGWMLQIPGHLLFEKNLPAFLNRPSLKERFLQLLIAPLWWMETVCLYPLWKKTP